MPEISCNLISCFLCTHCIPEWKALISVRKKTLLFKRGSFIFKEGDPVRGMYFVNSGVVKVTLPWGEVKELILKFSKTGDPLGHRGFGGESSYPISAIALTDAKLCYVENDFLDTLLQTNHAFTYQLLQVYARDLHLAEKRMRDMAHRDVKGRVSLALLELMDLFGLNEENFIRLPVSRQDIASYAGTSYETVFKFFNELAQTGIVTTSGKHIKIVEPQALKGWITQN